MDGLEQQDNGRLSVIRVDIQGTAGRMLALIYHIQYTPTFIFFDSQGRELWRSVGQLDTNLVNNSLR